MPPDIATTRRLAECTVDKYQLIIDGTKVATNEHFEVRNPSTGAVVGLAPMATAADLDRAISAARAAFANATA